MVEVFFMRNHLLLSFVLGFICDNKQIPDTWLNDDYCDCLDQTDEPLTSACNSYFVCRDNPNKLQIPSTWVNDRVCDCCDCSDESTIVGNNTCILLQKELKDGLVKQQKGFEIRQKWSTKSKELYSTIESELKDLKHLVEGLKTEKDSINTFLEEFVPKNVDFNDQVRDRYQSVLDYIDALKLKIERFQSREHETTKSDDDIDKIISELEEKKKKDEKKTNL